MSYRSLLTLVCSSLASSWLLADAPPSEKPSSKVNFPANFQVEGGANLFIFGDYLYWIAQEDGLYFAQETGNSSLTFKGDLKKIDPKFENGFRAGLGINFPKAGYELALYWTRFETNTRESLTKNAIPLFAEPPFSSFANSSNSSAKWDLKTDLIDLEWGRASWFGGNFSLYPFFGLRALLVDQSLSTDYSYTTTPVVTGSVRAKSDFDGVGLRAGANARFTLPGGFAFYGLASGSLLYGWFDADAQTKANDLLLASSKDRFSETLSAMQLSGGIAWDTHFAKDRLHLEIHIGWEQQLFLHLNKMNRYLNQLPEGRYLQETGNLTLQGLTVGGRFDF